MTRDRALRKIQACLRLAQSSEPHEAAAALRQAQALMAQYGVSESDVDAAAFASRHVGTRYGRAGIPLHVYALASCIAQAFECEVYERHEWNRSRIFAAIVFVGAASNSLVAKYAFIVLHRQLERQVREHTRRLRKRCNKVSRGAAFAEGWVCAVEAKMGRREIPAATRAGIRLHLHATGVDMLLSQCEHRDLVGKSSRTGDRVAGYLAGRDAQLHSGVEGAQQRQLEHAP